MSAFPGWCKKLLEQVKKSPNAVVFLEPVDWKALGLRDYPHIIKHPMDLGTMTLKQYNSVSDFDSDFNLIISNCQTYNAEGSEVYLMAEELRGEYERLKSKIWIDDAKKILAQLKKNQNAYIFLEPVDWKALGLNDYLKIVKVPMDLGTVSQKLNSDQYASMDAFFDDVLLIWSNCMLYNADGSEVFKMAQTMKAETEKLRAIPAPQTAVGTPAPTATAKRRKSNVAAAEPQGNEGEDVDMGDEEAEKRREDIIRMGKRFAALRHDYLGGAIRFIYAKCPKSVKLVDSGQFEIDLQSISDDTTCCDSINQLIKVMLYLQNNPE